VLLVSLAQGLGGQAAANRGILTASRQFQPPRFEAADGGYSRVTVAGCETLQRAGAPLVPFRTVRLALPPGGQVGQIAVRLPLGEQVLPGNWRIDYGRLPVASPSGPWAQSAATAAGPDPAIYESAQPYPPVRAELASLQQMAGYAVAIIRVYPVQCLPGTGEVVFAPEITVEVDAQSKSEAAETAPARPGALNRAKQTLGRWVENPEMFEAYAGAPTPKTDGSAIYDYLLITRTNLVAAFQPLVDLKTQAGLAVKVETVEAITSAYAGRDAPEKIRNYIRYAYTNWGVTYVLLGGDVASVPCRFAYVTVGSVVDSPNVPTDLYYGCLDGSWNRDNDTRWGEPTDGDSGGDVDLMAEVYVGRAPVDTVPEANRFVEKTVRYATQSHPGVTNGLFLAETLNAVADGGDMLDPLVPLFSGMELTWLDDRVTSPAWTRADAIHALNASPHLALMNGHSDWTYQTLFGWGNPLARSIEIPDLDGLTNQWPFLAYSVGCDVGRFDDPFWDSIGEEFLKRHNRGAFAAVFNTREGLYDELNEAKYSGEFQFQFFTNLLCQGHTNLGIANQLSKQDLLAHLESSGVMSYRWCYYEITLFGDPHLAWQSPAAEPRDSDGDGMLDADEEIAGTSPTNAASVLRLGVQSNGAPAGMRLAWPSASGRQYSIWVATNLATGGFVRLTNNLAATPPTNVFLDARPTAGARFYKLGVQRSP